jgi:hypothetical protein
MKNKIEKKNTSEVDRVILGLWKEKTTIIIFIIASLILTYIFIISKKERLYKSEITLNNDPFSILPEFDLVPKNKLTYNLNLNDLFFDQYHSLLQSKDNLKKFIDIFQIKNNFVFDPKLTKIERITLKKDAITMKYILISNHQVMGQTFLNDYIMYSFHKSSDILKHRLMVLLKAVRTHYLKNLHIAEEIPIDTPAIAEDSITSKSNERVEFPALFYLGSKVLSYQIENINNLIQDLDSKSFDYNLILDSANIGTPISKNSIIYILLATIFGFVSSIFFIYIKMLIKKT